MCIVVLGKCRCEVKRDGCSAVSGEGRARAAQESTVVRTLRCRRTTPADRYESVLHQINITYIGLP